ncbi:MAG TPA: hypothetical protein VGP04_19085 [Pseudonocardiaceae bacterium]|nr:hypothetical protein [Pseudonocardiaceae bacterium]
MARTVVAISPGSSDELLRKVIVRDDAADETSKQGEVVVVLGLGTAFLAATSAFAQLERVPTASTAWNGIVRASTYTA